MSLSAPRESETASALTMRADRPEAEKRRAHRFAGRAEIERNLEPAQHRANPLGKIVGHAIEQKRRRAERCRTLLPPAYERAVENHRAFGSCFDHRRMSTSRRDAMPSGSVAP